MKTLKASASPVYAQVQQNSFIYSYDIPSTITATGENMDISLNAFSGFTYAWACYQIPGYSSCNTSSATAYSFSNTATQITHPAINFIINQTYFFTLASTYSDGRIGYSSSLIIATDAFKNTTLTFGSPNYAVNFTVNYGQTIYLTNSNYNSSSNTTFYGLVLWNYTMQTLVKLTSRYFAVQTTQYSTLDFGNYPYLYVFFLPSNDSAKIIVNSIPTGGVLSCYPTAGASMSTYFSMQITGVTNAYTPFSYQFVYYRNLNVWYSDYTNKQFINGILLNQVNSSVWITQLPSGLYANNFLIVLGVVVTNTLGAQQMFY